MNIFNEIIKNVQCKIIFSDKDNKVPNLCPLEITILLHIVRILDDGVYCDVTAMDIYSIIYYYDTCSDELNNDHKKLGCKCLDQFKHQKSNVFRPHESMRETIKNFYEKSIHVNKTYDNYVDTILKKYCDGTEIKYNISHSVSYSDKEFKIKNKFSIVGHSNEYVYYTMIIPQFTKLNFNDIIFRIIFDNFLLKNSIDSHESNKKRFGGKKIITSIFTMSCINPIMFEIDTCENYVTIKECIKKYLFGKYSNLNVQLYNFYEFHKKENPGKNPVDVILDIFDEYGKKNSKFPTYVRNFYTQVKLDLEKDTNNGKKNRKNILARCDDKDLFLSEINCVLEFATKKTVGDLSNDVVDDEW